MALFSAGTSLLNLVFHGSGVLRPSSLAVEEGDRFFRVGQRNAIWVVDRLMSTKSCEIPHVIIERENDPRSSKVIALSALVDGHSYRRDLRAPEATNKTAHRRRRGDPPQGGGTRNH